MLESLPLKFLNPHWLLLLPLVMLVCWLFYRFYKISSMWNELCDDHLLKILLPKASKTKSGAWLIWTLMLVFLLAVFAAAGPSWRTQPIPLFESAASRVLVLDLSRSMLAQDVEPTRFRRAVYKARDLLNATEDGQTALIAFAGAAFLVSPLTDDKHTLLNFLDSLKPGIMPVQGSRVDLAIAMAEKILAGSYAHSSQIYILSDGVSELQAAIEQAKTVAKKDISVSILALGTQQGGPIKDDSGKLLYDQGGELIIAKVAFNDLEKIATAGNGRFVRMTASNQDINYLLSGFNDDELANARDSEEQTLNLPVNDGVWIVWLILPLALLLFRRNALWLVLIILLPLQQDAYAFDWSSIWKNSEQQAFEAYQKGDFEQAIELSKTPQIKGSAYYKSQDYTSAEAAYAQQNSAQSFYNRGNALAHMQQFDMAIAAYNHALSKNPQHQQAKHNKSLIEEFLRQQRSQQQNQDQSDDQGDESSDESADQSESDQSQSDQSRSPRSSTDDDLQADSTQEQQQEQKQVDPDEEQTNPADQDYAYLDQPQDESQRPNPESVDRWINRLPDDPSELLRRKFLRDYQRQRGRP